MTSSRTHAATPGPMSGVAQDPYASRVGGPCRVIERRDPVVRGGPASGPLDAAQLSEFADKGFLLLRGLLSEDEVAELQRETGRLASEADPEDPRTVIEREGGVVRSVFDPQDKSRRIHELVRDPRLAGAARQILGGEVYLHQGRVNYKRAFAGREFWWHSDFETWHVEDGMPRMRALSASIALTPIREFNGPLMLVPGSHRMYVSCPGITPEDHYKQSLKRQQYGTPPPEVIERLVERGGIEAPKGPEGSVLLFDCNTLHASSGNVSPWPRNQLFFVYNSVSNALVEPFGGLKRRPEFLAKRDIAPLT